MRWQCQLELKHKGGDCCYHGAPQSVASCAFYITWWSYCVNGVFPLWWEKYFVTTLRQHSTQIPIWLGKKFLHCISGVCYVWATACLHWAVLLKPRCSTTDLSQSCFTVWPPPKPVTQHEILSFVPHYELRELYSDFLGHIRTLLTS